MSEIQSSAPADTVRLALPPVLTPNRIATGVALPLYRLGGPIASPEDAGTSMPSMRFIPPTHRELPYHAPSGANVPKGSREILSDATSGESG